MAHVGKSFPRMNKFYVRYSDIENTAFPPRKMVVRRTSASPVGTLLASWPTSRTVSEVGDYWPEDGSWLRYIFTNPTDDENTIELLVRMERQAALPTGNHWPYVGKWKIEVWNAGFVLATNPVIPLEKWEDWSQPNSGGILSFLEWEDSTNTTLWDTGQFQFLPARWDEQPEYHPYRY